LLAYKASNIPVATSFLIYLFQKKLGCCLLY
jgi:hypothetical protein